MSFPADISAELERVCQEWNQAEAATKSAEQVHDKVIRPSVNALRYAGRRLVEGLDAYNRGEVDKAIELLRDAHFGCCRARHDALDAATSKIAIELSLALKLLGPEPLTQGFPDYPNLNAELAKIRNLIVVSRKQRDNRDRIYTTIQQDNLNTIIPMYEAFKANENVLVALAKNQRRKLVFAWTVAAVTTAIAIATLLTRITSWPWS